MFKFIEYNYTPSESIARIKRQLALYNPSEIPNKTLRYGQAVPKLTQYRYFTANSIPCPVWTQNAHLAKDWHSSGNVVYARKERITARGQGITLIYPINKWPGEDFLVYTKYIPNDREFRVNIFEDKFVNIREKLLLENYATRSLVRSSDNGYTTTHHLPIPDTLKERIKLLALAAAEISSSSFKGVDIIYNEDEDKLYVLEVNSAPAIQGSSVGEYVSTMLGAE